MHMTGSITLPVLSERVVGGANVEKSYSFTDLCLIMETLLSENGCPWDRVQTHESLRQNLLEESYEVVDAINQQNKDQNPAAGF